jgi:hypothetical protein
MIIIDTYVAQSKIEVAGLGCFANQDIKCGDVIWILNTTVDSILTQEDIDLLPEAMQKYVKTYIFWSSGKSMQSNRSPSFF